MNTVFPRAFLEQSSGVRCSMNGRAGRPGESPGIRSLAVKILSQSPLSVEVDTIGVAEWVEGHKPDIESPEYIKWADDVATVASDDDTFYGSLFLGSNGKYYTVLPFVVEAEGDFLDTVIRQYEEEEEAQNAQIGEIESRLAQLRTEAVRRQARLGSLKSAYKTLRE